jgi:hypothetical protein
MIRKALLAIVPFVLGGLVHTATADTPPPFANPGVETQTGQAVYQLPRDHAWHGGAFYQTNDYKVIPSRMWTSPKSGKSYPWWGRIETPQGTYYYEPTHPEVECKSSRSEFG